MEQRKFELVSNYKPSGDQPDAIISLSNGVLDGLKEQVLLGVTGSGKTFTMANIIEKVQRPTLVLAHNKTLAAQLCNELKEFFPNNRVEYFVSYYDYYQPEAYIVSSDTYIEKDMAINDEIDKLRHSATSSLLERSDVIVVSSVSCIYGLGAPEEYFKLHISIREGDKLDRNELIKKLINIQYSRSEIDFVRSTFRSKGDVVEIFPSSSSQYIIRVEFFDDIVEKITECDSVTLNPVRALSHVAIFPASHYAVGSDKLKAAINNIKADMEEREKYFKDNEKLIEAQRIKERVSYDCEMLTEMGYTNGIENYSRYFDGRKPGEPPYTLLDYFPDNFLTIIDESHMTLPQIRAMYNGDKARKTTLVEYGFRLPAAFDNRPLNFNEFNDRIKQVIYVSATPSNYELERASNVAEQIIRPTGLVDPSITVLPIKNQIEVLIDEINKTIKNNARVLVTTLTKKMAEDRTDFLTDRGIKVRYLHSEIDTLERIEIINGLRAGEFDVLVGINLLREGIDMPEVELVAILDADKEGFLRSDRALIQTIGRAARNSNGHVIMFADNITDSMKRAIDETERRRKKQINYNKVHNIIPKTIIKEIKNSIEISKKVNASSIKKQDIPKEIERLKGLMQVASSSLDFEKAIIIRDQISALKKKLNKKD